MIPQKHQRQRKTKDPCRSCFLHKNLCICALIPRLELSTHVSLLIHHRELKRTTNTGRLAALALKNCAIHVRGLPDQRLAAETFLKPGYTTLLLYPSEDATVLDDAFVATLSRPVQLIVPDGNWRQASKVHTRHPELAEVPRVKLCVREPLFTATMRAESKPDGMATLEAIAYALGVLEGVGVQQQLLDVYHWKCDRTLQARGISQKGLDG